jgi:hypothetical protein
MATKVILLLVGHTSDDAAYASTATQSVLIHQRLDLFTKLTVDFAADNMRAF